MVVLVDSGVDKSKKCQKIELMQHDSHAVLICTECHCHYQSTKGTDSRAARIDERLLYLTFNGIYANRPAQKY
jgi:hypothetical protein